MLYHSQVSYLGRSVGCFSCLEACTVPLGSMKAKTLEGCFWVSSSSEFFSEMHDVIKDLPSNSGENKEQWQGPIIF